MVQLARGGGGKGGQRYALNHVNFKRKESAQETKGGASGVPFSDVKKRRERGSERKR